MAKQGLKEPFYVLSLDGGGSLGVYSLGVLIEIERMLGVPLHRVFDLVYGTSTGSIIGSMVALGERVETVRELYFEVVPDIMGRWLPRTKSAALHRQAARIFGEKVFSDFLVDTGIVATHLEYNRPMIFKHHAGQAHGGHASFRSGFGCTIADAVIASCAAHPFFQKKVITTPDHGDRSVVDGGFTANNPALFALADALGPLRVPRAAVRIVSVGTGQFPARRRLLNSVNLTRTIMTLLGTSSNTVTVIQKLLFRDVHMLRIDESFTDIRTDFLESSDAKLKKIFQLGRRSFENHEAEIRRLFESRSRAPQ